MHYNWDVITSNDVVSILIIIINCLFSWAYNGWKFICLYYIILFYVYSKLQLIVYVNMYMYYTNEPYGLKLNKLYNKKIK